MVGRIAAAAVVGTTLMGLASSVQASTPTKPTLADPPPTNRACELWVYQNARLAGDGDPGGVSAQAAITKLKDLGNGELAVATFHAKDEYLTISNNIPDGAAVVTLYVGDSKRTFYANTNEVKLYNLSYPENQRVILNLQVRRCFAQEANGRS